MDIRDFHKQADESGQLLEAMAVASSQLVKGFGDGWLTRNAGDMVRIAAIAGFNVKDLIRRLAFTRSRGERLNTRTVERIMAEMASEADAAADEAQP